MTFNIDDDWVRLINLWEVDLTNGSFDSGLGRVNFGSG